jgi:predicted extracellular nuclease
MKKHLLKFLLAFFVSLFLSVGWVNAQNAWINEIHYDDNNSTGDLAESVEVVVENPGLYGDLSGFVINLYNGSGGAIYDTDALNTFTEGSSYGNFTVYSFVYPQNGIQNGGPDGVALSYNGTLIQFLSYEGTFTGVGGVADGILSTNIGVSEGSTTPAGSSLQLSGTGSVYSDFAWQVPATATLGLTNNSQTLVSGNTPPQATFSPADAETNVAVDANITITFDEKIYTSGGVTEIVDGDLATLITLKETDAAGADVPFSATYSNADPFVITIDPTSDLTNSTDYYVAFGSVFDDANQENTGENATFTTIASNYLILTDPVGGEKYYAGDTLWVAWDHANVDTVDVLAYVPEMDSWELMANDSVCDGSLYFIIPSDAGYSTGYRLALQDIANPTTVADTSATFTVISTPTINDIQSDNTAGLSNYDGDIVRTSGIITFSGTGEYVIQDGDGSWNGIYVFDYGFDLTSVEGDHVTIEAKVANYNQVTQLSNVVSLVVNSSGNPLPAITTVTTVGLTEEYEGVLVQVVNAQVTNNAVASGIFEINDGSGALNVDDNLYSNAEVGILNGRDLTITGIGYDNNGLQLLPRYVSDIVSATDTVGSTVYTVDQLGLAITGMPYSTTLAVFESNITAADTATFDVFDVDGTTPASVLDDTKLLIVTAADGITEATYTITRNAALTDATVTSTEYDVDNGLETITNIPNGETLATFISNVTAPTYGSFIVYEADGTTPATNLVTGYKLIATAEDGTTTKTYVITVSDIIADTDSEVIAPTTQVATATVAVVDGDETTEAFEVFSFDITDAGTADGLDTKVSQIVLYYGSNMTINFETEIDSGYFEVDGLPIDLDGEPVFGNDSVAFPILGGEISVPDGGSVNVVIKLIVKPNTTDGKVIQFMIDANQHGFETAGVSSLFPATLAGGDIIGNDITIDVVATELNFSVEPTNVYVDAMITPAIVVEAIDANGNIDTDYVTDVSITATGATLVGTHTETPVAGVATFDALSFSDEGTGVTLTAASGTLTNGTSATFNVTVEPEKDLFFSEYIEGDGGNNKALEIYNGTGADVDLHDYVIRINGNGSEWTSFMDFPVGTTIPNEEVYVIAHSAAIAEILAVTDSIVLDPYGGGTCFVVVFNGNDARALCKVEGSDTTIIDIIGEELVDSLWSVAGIEKATQNHTLLRKPGTTIGNANWTSSAGTNLDDSEWEVKDANYFDDLGKYDKAPSSEAEILTFVMAEEKETATINSGAGTIDITVVNGTPVTALVPTITISEDATISPESGVAQDFSTPVDYTITAEDGTEKVWTVTVTVSATLSDKAEILTFSIPDMDDVTINPADTSILVNMPYGTDASALTPTFTISAGASVDVASGTEQDFSTPFTYTVTAQNTTNVMEWEVTVEVVEAAVLTIHDIQYTTATPADSPYKGELVKTSGIVTATNVSGFFIQDGDGAWNGIYVYNNSVTRAVGDEVEFTSTVDEYNNLTELKNVVDFNVLSQDNALPTAAEITTVEGNDEEYESVLVYLDDVLCTDPDMNYGMFEINDGSGALLVDDVLYAFAADSLAGYDLTGIGYVYGTEYKVLPRSADDVVLVSPVIGAPTLSPETPTSSEAVTITASITDNDNDASELTTVLSYGDAEGSEDTDVTFAETATANEFEGTIPASASTVYYLISATDGTFDAEYTGSYSVITGIDNPDGIVSMNIFPNPSEGLFTLEMNASKAGSFNVEIINIQGQVVYSKQINQDGFYKDQIDISKEAKGIYYIRINDGVDMQVSKIIIQ